MKKNGFVLSTYVYILLVFFLLLLVTMLAVLNNTKLLSDKLKRDSYNASGLIDKDFSFVLLGDMETSIAIDDEYIEPGFIAQTSKGKDLKDNVKVVGNVDTSTVGEYTLTYRLTYNGVSKELKRIVKVITLNVTFNYLEKSQTYTVLKDGYYKIEAYGASGGSFETALGGKGAYTSGVIYLNKGDILYAYVGQEGSCVSNTSASNTFNGGGGAITSSINDTACRGGGATDIRLISGLWYNELSLNSRIMVAAGGGGAYYHTLYIGNGGAGGRLTGDSPTNVVCIDRTFYSGSNSSQSSGGTNTACNNSYTSSITGLYGVGGFGSEWSSGGGGGYYGGGYSYATGGSGGSSFISGYAGVNAITSNIDRTHTNNTIHYSNKYFVNGKMTSGVNTGNGSAKITYLGNEYDKTNTNLNNVRYIKDCVSGNAYDSINRWNEIQVMVNGINIAKGKIAYMEDGGILSREEVLTDGDIGNAGNSDSYSESSCIIVDLDSTYNIDEIAIWHNWGDMYKAINDNYTYVSSDKSSWTKVIDIQENVTSNGKRVSAYN